MRAKPLARRLVILLPLALVALGIGAWTLGSRLTGPVPRTFAEVPDGATVVTERLHAALPEPKRSVLIDGAGHGDLERWASADYWNIVEPFLERHLAR